MLEISITLRFKKISHGTYYRRERTADGMSVTARGIAYGHVSFDIANNSCAVQILG